MAEDYNKFDDNVLMNLRRQYSKDETVAAMEKKMKQLEFKSGQDDSEIKHLTDEVNKLASQLKKALQTIEDNKPENIVDKRIYQRNATIKKLEKRVERYKKSNEELILQLNELRNE